MLEVVIQYLAKKNNGREELNVIHIERLRNNGMMKICARITEWIKNCAASQLEILRHGLRNIQVKSSWRTMERN